MSHASTNNKQKTNRVNVGKLWTALRDKLNAQSSLLAMKLDDVLEMEQKLNAENGTCGSKYIAKTSLLYHIASQPLGNMNYKLVGQMRDSLIIVLTLVLATNPESDYLSEYEGALATILMNQG